MYQQKWSVRHPRKKNQEAAHCVIAAITLIVITLIYILRNTFWEINFEKYILGNTFWEIHFENSFWEIHFEKYMLSLLSLSPSHIISLAARPNISIYFVFHSKISRFLWECASVSCLYIQNWLCLIQIFHIHISLAYRELSDPVRP